MNMRLKTGLGAVALALALVPGTAKAEYPSRTIEILVGFAAGGPVDTVTRAMAPFLEKHIGGGASIAVINRPGASGAVAAIATARANPDGHTLLMMSYPSLVTALFGDSEPPYSLDDFEYLGNVTSDPHNVFVSADGPYQTLEDLLEAARANPGRINFVGAGVGGAGQLAALVFENAAEVSFNYVPADGGAGVLTQILGGHVDVGVTTISALVPYLREGQMRVLASMASEPPPQAPEVPTARQQGVDVLWGALRGIIAPAGLPDDVRERLAAAVEATMNDPEFIAVAERQGIPLLYLDGATFQEIVDADLARLTALWESNPWD